MSTHQTILIQDCEIPFIRPLRRLNRFRFRSAQTFSAIVLVCPFCTKPHEHGWGTGTRAAHCVSGAGTYYLECGDGQDSQDT